MKEYDAPVLLDGDGQDIPEDPVLDGESDMSIGSRYIDREQTGTPLHRQPVTERAERLSVDGLVPNVDRDLLELDTVFRGLYEHFGLEPHSVNREGQLLYRVRRERTEPALDIRDGLARRADGGVVEDLLTELSVLVFVLRMIRKRHPSASFSLPGVAMLLLGCGVAIHSLFLYQSEGTLFRWRVTLGAVAIALGAVTLSIGLTKTVDTSS